MLVSQVLDMGSKLKTQIGAVAENTARLAVGSQYVIYAILDPRIPDARGEYEGTPVYVGMSRDIAKRVKRHYYGAYKVKPRARTCPAFLRELAEEGVVAKFMILDWASNEVEAADAETLWAQHLLAQGYTLTNQWRAQCAIVPEGEIDRRLRNQYWYLPISSAIEGQLRVRATCDWCGDARVFWPQEFLAYFLRTDPLRMIRSMAASCNSCGTTRDHEIVRPTETAISISPPLVLWEE